MQTQELIREFKHGSVKLADPNPAFSLEQVREFYATAYPELLNADIEGPELRENRQIYTFRRAVGTKGATVPEAIAQLKKHGTLATPAEPKRQVTINSSFSLKLHEVMKALPGAERLVASSTSISILP